MNFRKSLRMAASAATLLATVGLTEMASASTRSYHYTPPKETVQLLGTKHTTPTFLGLNLQRFGTENTIANYGRPAIGIVSSTGYVGFTPPIIRMREVIGGSKDRPIYGNDMYSNHPSGKFSSYQQRIYFPADAIAVSIGIKVETGAGLPSQGKVTVQSFELPMAPTASDLGPKIVPKVTGSKVVTLGAASSRYNFLVSPKIGRLGWVAISSTSPFNVGDISALRTSLIKSLKVRLDIGTFAPFRNAVSSGMYVALGDSFSSGEGAGIFNYSTSPYADNGAYIDGTWFLGKDDDVNGDTPFGCHRAKHGWVERLSDTFNSSPPLNSSPMGLDFRACSGARTIDMFEPNHNNYSETPQFDALSAKTSIVTISIGVNDLGFSALLSECGHTTFENTGPGDCKNRLQSNFDRDLSFLSQSDWSSPGVVDPKNTGHHCHQAYPDAWKARNSGKQNVGNEDLDGLDAKAGTSKFTNDYVICNTNYRLADLYFTIARLAPNAKIYVVGYPNLFTTCAQQDGNIVDLAPYQWLADPRIDCVDMTWLASVTGQIKNTLSGEVDIANKLVSSVTNKQGPITYVDAANAGLQELNFGVQNDVGHEMANQGDLNGIIFENNSGGVDKQIRPESFHPNLVGQARLYSYLLGVVVP